MDSSSSSDDDLFDMDGLGDDGAGTCGADTRWAGGQQLQRDGPGAPHSSARSNQIQAAAPSQHRPAIQPVEVVQTLTVTQATESTCDSLGLDDAASDSRTRQHPAIDFRSQQRLAQTQPFYTSDSPAPPARRCATADSSSDSGIDTEDEEVAALFRRERVKDTQQRVHAENASQKRALSARSPAGASLDLLASRDAKPAGRTALTNAAPGLDLVSALHGRGSGVLKRKCSVGAAAPYQTDRVTSQDFAPPPQQQQRSPLSQREDAQSPRKKARLSPKLPQQPFRLIMTKGVSAKANAGCPRLRWLLKLDGTSHVVLSNYMYDFNWLARECPYLLHLHRLTIIHHARESRESDEMEATKPPNAVLHAPPLPVPFGTMHSKCALVFSPECVRVMITTANFISIDWENKTQAVWSQDFPVKTISDYDDGKSSGEFEESLVEYFEVVGGFDAVALRKFDFSSARGKLVASVPGYHRGNAIHKWGHMRLRTLLRTVAVAPRFDSVVCQFSSMGAVSEKWIRQNWLPSVGSSRSSGAASDRPPMLQLVIPTEAEVRNSVEGWAAGQAIPIQRAKHKPFMRQWKDPPSFTDQGFAANHGQTVDLYHRWTSKDTATVVDGGDTYIDDGCSGRAKAMPHIKTFARYCNDAHGHQPTEFAWCLVTSHNFGPSPWGDLQKAQTQLMIRSYELGILFTPETELEAQRAMGTGNVASVRLLHGVGDVHAVGHDVAGAAELGAGEAISWIPLPYKLPPAPYRQGDVPWAHDVEQHQLDSLGNIYLPGKPLMMLGPRHLHHKPSVRDLDEVGGAGAAGAGARCDGDGDAGASDAGAAAAAVATIATTTASGNSGSLSAHDKQYRQQQLRRQHQQKLLEQQTNAIPNSVSDKPSLLKRNSSGYGSSGRGSATAQWSWKAGAGWQPYDGPTTDALECAHGRFFACKHTNANPDPFTKVEVSGGRHVNLAAMLQVVTAAPGRTRHVRRRGPAPRTSDGGARGKPLHSRDTWI